MTQCQSLYITDGTNSVDLLSTEKTTGFCLNEWSPKITEPKQGGVWADSPIVEGRKLVQSIRSNVVEQFDLAVVALDTDELAIMTRQLRTLLEQAQNYWVYPGQYAPVYFIAQATGESSARYSIIYAYTTPVDGDWVDFWNDLERASFPEFSLLIEREPTWADLVPGQGEDVALSSHRAEFRYSRVLGYTSAADVIKYTTSKAIYANAQHTRFNITHVFTYDLSTTTYSANLATLSAHNLFPNPVQVGDQLYVGIEVTSEQFVFNNVIFNINPGATLTVLAEQFNGGFGWGTISPRDNTNQFNASGINGWHWWNPNSDELEPMGQQTTPLNVNGVLARWIRFTVLSVGGSTTPPQQQSERVYSCMWNMVEIEENDIGGDVDAWAKSIIFDEADSGSTATKPKMRSNILVAGLRSYERGDKFWSMINCSSETGANQAGITTTVTAPAVFYDNTYPWWAAGRVVRISNVASPTLTAACTFTLNAATMLDYYGRFRVYARIATYTHFTGAAQDIQLQLEAKIGSGGLSSYSDVAEFDAPLMYPTAYFLRTIDLGLITIPAGNLLTTEQGDQTQLILNVKGHDTAIGSGYTVLLDICLIPADQWIGVLEDPANSDNASYLRLDHELSIDSVTNPAVHTRSILWNNSSQAVAAYIPGSPRYAMRPEYKQRLFIFPMRYEAQSIYPSGTQTALVSYPGMSYRIQTQKREQFISLKGAS